MDTDSKIARYETLAWDGCGIWRMHRNHKRDDARYSKGIFQRNTEPKIDLSKPRNSWPTVKIWDRKRREFIT